MRPRVPAVLLESLTPGKFAVFAAMRSIFFSIIKEIASLSIFYQNANQNKSHSPLACRLLYRSYGNESMHDSSSLPQSTTYSPKSAKGEPPRIIGATLTSIGIYARFVVDSCGQIAPVTPLRSCP